MPIARRLLGLDVERVLEAGGEEVLVVGGRGAARHQELGQGETGGEAEALGRDTAPRPDRAPGARETAPC